MHSIPFSQFMAEALYDPVFGYYNQGPRIGRTGDFFTSVSVGSTFGQILACQVVEVWKALGKPSPFHLVEQGGHDGTLAKDLLEELKWMEPDCMKSVEFVMVEPLEKLRTLQQEKIAEFKIPFRQVSSWEELPENGLSGFFYSNELVDSFPVDLVTFQNGKWFEKRVIFNSNPKSYEWHLEEIESSHRLKSWLEHLPPVEGYLTELHVEVEKWVRSVMRVWKEGLILISDYGYPRSVYYSPERVTGTLQTYREHQKSDQPLEDVGEQDITTHVNFTLLYQSFLDAGAEWIGFTDQNRYLTGMGEEWLCRLAEIHPPEAAEFQKKIREFKSLTHPEMMGSRFHMLSMGKGLSEEKNWKGYRFGSRVPL